MKRTISNSIKKETAIIIAIFCFIGGFLAGVVYCSYKSTPDPSQTIDQEGASGQQQEEQILALVQQVEANPENIDVLIRLGDLYFDNNRHQEAIGVFNKAELIEPENIHVLNDLGTLSMNIGDYDAALEKFHKVLEIDPNHSHSLYYIGIVYRDRGEKDKALQSFEKVLSLNPSPQLMETVQQEIDALNGNLLPQ